MKAEGKTLNNQKFNDIKDEEVRSIFENINKKLYEKISLIFLVALSANPAISKIYEYKNI